MAKNKVFLVKSDLCKERKLTMDAMLGRLVRLIMKVPAVQLGILCDLLEKLTSKEGASWIENLRLFLRKEPCWGSDQVTQVAEPKPTSPILELVSTIVVNATTTGQFVAKEKFVVNADPNAGVKISYLGNNFTEWFLSGDGKTESPITEQTLRYHKLRRLSVDGPIITELGGEEKSETTLSEMFSLMEKQKHGEDGVLLNNGLANIFFIKGSTGVLRGVAVLWDDGGWRICADPVGDPGRRDVGSRVFSRNTVFEHSDALVPAQA